MSKGVRELFFLLLINFILIGCNVSNDKKNRFDFESMLDSFLLNTKYTKEVSFNKNELDVSTIFVKKSDVDKIELENFLIQNKFRRIDPMFEDQEIYCFDKNNQITVTYPMKEYYKNKNGDIMEIKRKNMNKIIILYRYNIYGISNCV